MPRKARYHEEKRKRLIKANLDNLPDHIKKRLGQLPRLNLATELPAIYSYRGLQSNELGESWLPEGHQRTNKIRADRALEAAKKCEGKYPEIFWCREKTSYIAKQEKIDPTTVRRMRARLKNKRAG